jgi:hypothetical protein
MDIRFFVEHYLVTDWQLNGTEEEFQYSVSRDVFSQSFPEVNLSSCAGLNYEPSRGIFHINQIEGGLLVLESPSEDERMDYIDKNFSAIHAWFTQKRQEEIDLMELETQQVEG